MAFNKVHPLASNTSFGGYQFLARLDAGGMAEIFIAREVGSTADELLVIKRLHPHVARHPQLVQMFLDEARIASTLDHPNIVNIHNVGAIADQYFLSMDYLLGFDLAKVCERLWRSQVEVPLNLTLHVIDRVLDALSYAHEKIGSDGTPLGIVHRDVSPHNIFVSFDGDVKLLDFGVAKAANALHHTKTGALVGKVSYMSPEQCRSARIDNRSDLFSLGIVLYELTTGRRLYSTKKLGEFEVLRQICDEPVKRPSELRRNYPQPIEDIVLKALEKEPENRFNTADDMSRSLRNAGEELGLELSREKLVEFVNERFSSEIKAAQGERERLKAAAAGKEPFSPLSGITPSGSFPTGRSLTPSRSSAVSAQRTEDDGLAEEWDVETQQLARPTSSRRRKAESRVQKVEWKPLPHDPSPHSVDAEAPTRIDLRSKLVLALAVGVIVLAATVALLWLL